MYYALTVGVCLKYPIKPQILHLPVLNVRIKCLRNKPHLRNNIDIYINNFRVFKPLAIWHMGTSSKPCIPIGVIYYRDYDDFSKFPDFSDMIKP